MSFLVWCEGRWTRYTHAVEDFYQQTLLTYRAEMSATVDGLAESINRKSNSFYQELESHLDQRLTPLHRMIMAIVQDGSSFQLDADALKELLAIAGYDGADGYIFILDMDGTIILMPPDTDLEGLNVKSLADPTLHDIHRAMVAALADKDRAFLPYEWLRPGHTDPAHPKLSLIKSIPELQWIMGMGVYYAEAEAGLKQDALAMIESAHIPSGSYLFASHMDGTPLVGPATEVDPARILDPNDVIGRAFAIAKAASIENGPTGGFVEYQLPRTFEAAGKGEDIGPITDDPADHFNKLSYLRTIAQWDWMIGTGIDLSAIDALTAVEADHLRDDLHRDLLLAALVFCLLLTLFLAASHRASGRLKQDMAHFSALTRAASTPVAKTAKVTRSTSRTSASTTQRSAADMPTDPSQDLAQGPRMGDDDFNFDEFRDLAADISHLAEDRRVAAEILEARTEDLNIRTKELERFAELASHDLQEPLRTVTGFLTLLRRRMGERLPPEEREFIGYAVDGANRMRDQLIAILELSRLDQHQPQRRMTDMTALVQGVLATAIPANQTSAKPSPDGATPMPASIDYALDGLGTDVVDAPEVRRLFFNLIRNAATYIREDGIPKIRISRTTLPDGRTEYWVADNGPGIDPLHHQRVFQIFRKLGNQRGVEGVGIGLAMCERIVRMHGGEITLDSEAGEGCRVSFTLSPPPAAHAAMTTRHAPYRKAADSNGPVA